MLSRTNVVFLVAAWACLSCGGSDEKLTAAPAAEADDDGAGETDDDALPGFSNGDDDAMGDDDALPMGDDDVAVEDDAMDDDVAAPMPTVEAPGDDLPVGDDDVAAPADDDLGTDDDVTPVMPSDDDVPAPVVPGGIGGVGSACETDGDCMSGLECLDSSKSYFGGVYPNGECTADCTADPFVCDTLGGLCVGSEAEAWCTPLCPTGGSGIKCRADQTCIPYDTEYLVGYCDALCRDDLDCPDGLECEAGSGLCVEMAHTGLSLGEACTVAEADACASSFCLPPTGDGTEGMCSQACNLTEELSICGAPRDAEGPAPGACDPVTSLVVSGLPLSPGDLGLCTSTCDLDTGCLPGWTCAELIPEAQETVGHDGLCIFSDLVEEEVPTGDAGAP